MVLAFGLSSVISPRSMTVAADADAPEAARLRRTMARVMIPAGGIYLLVTAVDWSLNPIGYLVPAGYVVTGLVAVTALTNIVLAIELPLRAEMIGARLERAYASITSLASVGVVLVAASSPFTRAFARAIGEAVRVLGQIGGYSTALATEYRRRSAPEAT